MRARIKHFKVCNCREESFSITKHGKRDIQKNNMDKIAQRSSKEIQQNREVSAKKAAEAALDWLLSSNNKTKAFVIQ